MTYRVLATKKRINQQGVDRIFRWFAWPLGWFIQ